MTILESIFPVNSINPVHPVIKNKLWTMI